jgi:hypothetical protein
MKIQFTKHTYLKSNERETEKKEVKQVMEPPEEILLDFD